MTLSIRVLVSLATAVTSAASAQKAPCGRLIPVDLRARTVAGVALDTVPERLVQLLGPSRVRVDTAYPEGHASTVHDVEFCGHAVRRHWNSVSWADSVFRTVEGLGVGSRIQDFDREYGEGEGIWGEGPAVRYSIPGAKGHFFLEAGGQCFAPQPGKIVIDRSCRVTRISFIILSPPHAR
jgi:hypothetical protein